MNKPESVHVANAAESIHLVNAPGSVTGSDSKTSAVTAVDRRCPEPLPPGRHRIAAGVTPDRLRKQERHDQIEDKRTPSSRAREDPAREYTEAERETIKRVMEQRLSRAEAQRIVDFCGPARTHAWLPWIRDARNKVRHRDAYLREVVLEDGERRPPPALETATGEWLDFCPNCPGLHEICEECWRCADCCTCEPRS